MADRRYRYAREYCGHATPQWVVRFCGDWLGAFPTRAKARERVAQHVAERNAEFDRRLAQARAEQWETVKVKD